MIVVSYPTPFRSPDTVRRMYQHMWEFTSALKRDVGSANNQRLAGSAREREQIVTGDAEFAGSRNAGQLGAA